MNFVDTINSSAFILTEGAVIERLNRDPSVDLDPHILNSGLIYDDQGRTALEIIYRQYIDIGLKYNFPILLSAPTWRANPERIDAAVRITAILKPLRQGFIKFIRSYFK